MVRLNPLSRIEPLEFWDISVAGRSCVRVWDERRGQTGRLTVECAIEAWDPATPRHRLRSRTTLQTGADLRPRMYTVAALIPGSGFRSHTVLRFGDGTVVSEFRDGTRVDVPLAPGPLVVIGQNMVPHLAALIGRMEREQLAEWDGTYFAPETLQQIPYQLVRTPMGFTSSMGEELVMTGERLTTLRIASLDVRARRRRGLLPNWAAVPSAPERPRRLMPAPAAELAATSPRISHGTEEVDLTIQDGGPTLGYTLLRPTDIAPIATVLFVGGSGAHDRDGVTGTFHLGYADLLRRLARRGIVSVRFDTRGAGSTPLGADFTHAGFRQRVSDSGRMLTELQERHKMSRPILMGHSEGGLIGLVLASQVAIRGLVLAATAARSIDEVFRSQIRAVGEREHVPEALTAERIARFNELVEVALRVPDKEWVASAVPPHVLALRPFACYLREAVPLEPLRLLDEVSCPLLVVQGGADQQVSPGDARELENAARRAGIDVTALFAPRANHLLRTSSDPPTLWDYFDGRRRVTPEIVDGVAAWCERLASRREGSADE